MDEEQPLVSSDEERSETSSISDKEYTLEQRLILLLLILAKFITNASLSLPPPFLPNEDEKHNLGSEVTGLIISLPPLIQIVITPLIGKLPLHFGIKRTVALAVLLDGVFTILFGMIAYLPQSDGHSIDWLYIGLAVLFRSGQGLGIATFIISSLTLISVVFDGHTTKIYSYAEAAIGLGFMSGPAIGSGLYTQGGFMLVFTVVGSLMIFISLVALVLIRQEDKPTVIKPATQTASVASVLSSGTLLLSTLFAAFAAVIWTGLDPILEPELRRKFGWRAEFSALAFTPMSFCYLATTPLIARLLEKFKWLDNMLVMGFGAVVAFVAFFFSGPPFFVYQLPRPAWVVLCCNGLMGIAVGLMAIPSVHLFFGGRADEYDDENEEEEALRAAKLNLLSCVWTAAYAAGNFGGPVLSGIVTAASSFAFTMTCYAIISAFLFLLVVVHKIGRLCRVRYKLV